MRRTRKRIISLLLAAVMLFSLTACGKKDDAGSTKSEGVLYSFEDIKLPDDVSYIDTAAYSNNTVFIAYTSNNFEYSEDDLSEDAESESEETVEETGEEVLATPSIMKMEIGSDNWVQIPLTYDADKSYNVHKILTESDGSLWLLLYSYSMTVDEDGEYTSDETKYELISVSESGEVQKSIDLSSATSESSDSSSVYFDQIQNDDSGNWYVSGGNDVGSFLYVLDSEGNKLFQVEGVDYVDRLIKLGSGKVACTYYSVTEQEYIYKAQEIDTETKALGEEYEISGNYATIYNCIGDDLYISDSSNLNAYNLASGEQTVLLNWVDNNINASNIDSLIAISEEQFIYSTYGDGGNGSLVLATKTDETLGDAEIITLGGIYIDDSIKSEAIAFNKKNEGVRINIKDYMSGQDDYEAAIQQMNSDILAGDMPDIVSSSGYGLSIEQLVAKGLLEDLYTYIDSDEEISKDDFIPSVLSASEIDGGLYTISSGFYILTMVGKSEIVGEDMGWTFKEMLEVVNAHPEADYPLGSYYSKSEALNSFLYFASSDFVNWSTGECNFDTDDFKSLLEFVNSLPAEVDYDAEMPSSVELLRSNRQLFEITAVYGYDQLQYERALFGAEVTFIGLPVSEGVGNAVQFDSAIGLSSQSEHKDEAWQFIRTILSDEYQEPKLEEQFQYSTMQKWLDKGFEKAMTNDNDSWSTSMDDFTYESTNPTQEEVAKYKEVINSVSQVVSFDNSMNEIVLEEAESYFAGDKSVDETASIIQNRVETYINEQR